MLALKPRIVRLLALFLIAASLAFGFQAAPAMLASTPAPAGVGIIHSDGTVTEASEREDAGTSALPAAEAYTDYRTSNCSYYGIMLYCYYWRDYSWSEEVFQRKKDGYVYKFTGQVR